ncbi:hypothetical protein MMC16_006506 [Acarospora aff. strigata]|nr:hypothetical protein [Acarospora aff. strigata]
MGSYPETETDVEPSLDRLLLANVQKHSDENRQSIVESWEDDLSSGDDTEKEHGRGVADIPNAPPPTPVSPTFSSAWNETDSATQRAPGRIDDGGSPYRSTFRPEKQTAVAGRLIAGALGIRAPKKNEEQKAYDKAVKEKEIRKLNGEREAQARAKQDAERAKAAIWEE